MSSSVERNKRLYNVWSNMLHRCEDPRWEKYRSYGGRGIRVCSEWHDHDAFFRWAEMSGYSDGLQLDRIDNDGPYSPENCRWVTAKQNARNRRDSKYLTLLGIRRTVAEWCEVLEISRFTLYSWMRRHGEKECERRVYERLSKQA